MMTALTLWLATVLFLLGSWASYNDKFRAGQWYSVSYISLGILSAMLWVWATGSKTKEQVFTYSLYWDSLMVACYYVAPLFLMGLRPTAGVLVGSLLILSGILVVKLGG